MVYDSVSGENCPTPIESFIDAVKQTRLVESKEAQLFRSTAREKKTPVTTAGSSSTLVTTPSAERQRVRGRQDRSGKVNREGETVDEVSAMLRKRPPRRRLHRDREGNDDREGGRD